MCHAEVNLLSPSMSFISFLFRAMMDVIKESRGEELQQSVLAWLESSGLPTALLQRGPDLSNAQPLVLPVSKQSIAC